MSINIECSGLLWGTYYDVLCEWKPQRTVRSRRRCPQRTLPKEEIRSVKILRLEYILKLDREEK